MGNTLEISQIRGVNISGWLVLEPWVTPSLFAGTGSFDEDGIALSLGNNKYHELLQTHRSTFITLEDFKRIADRGYNCVRLVLPWYVFGSANAESQGYVSCIEYVDRAFEWADATNIKVLISMALIPEGHSAKDEQAAYIDPADIYRASMLNILSELAKRYGNKKSLLGIEPLRQPVVQKRQGLSTTPGIPVHMLRNFYRDSYEVIRNSTASDHKPLIVFADGGSQRLWSHFMASDKYENVALDLHLFHQNDAVDAHSPSGIRYLVDRSAKSIRLTKKSGLPIIVGEWSSALPSTTATPTPEGRLAMERIYASAQLELFDSAASGWFFQTWKTESKLSAWDARVALSSFERDMFD